jgi:hypothetical protein
MTQVLKTKPRFSSELNQRYTTTNLIPIGRISPNDVYQRTVRREVFPSGVFIDCGTPTLPIPDAPEPVTAAMRTIQAVWGSGASHFVALKKAHQEILNVNRAALQVFIGFSQAAGASFQVTAPTFAPDLIVSFPESTLLVQAKMNEESVEDERPVFYEPLTFDWTKKANEIRQAAKRYSEKTHADY